jgi:hypothetical protein
MLGDALTFSVDVKAALGGLEQPQTNIANELVITFMTGSSITWPMGNVAGSVLGRRRLVDQIKKKTRSDHCLVVGAAKKEISANKELDFMLRCARPQTKMNCHFWPQRKVLAR